MDDEYIREGESFEVTLTDTDLSAATATLTVSNDTITVSETANYSTLDDKQVATITLNDPTLVVGEYEYMYTVTYTGGFVAKFPDSRDCEDDSCELPKFIVCVANDVENS